jgi:pyruvate-formate lyase
MDKNGVTALIQSATKLVPSNYHESFCVDVMLHPSAVAGESGYNVFRGILMTYLKKGGQSIQFNIFDTETLRDAQNHPEKYQNLQVRVCGWNTLWNNMNKKEQDAYILRAENIR